jgi:endonuclease/exonuclease/phosphatase family metal-dependent hydrolase
MRSTVPRRLALLMLPVLVAIAVLSVAGDQTGAVSPHTGTFRIATFNIHKGADEESRYDLQRTIAAIAALDADAVGLQEVMRNHPGLNCDDQAALIAEGLTRISGRIWSHVYAQSWILDDRDCEGRGLGDGVATEGVALLTPDRIVATDQIRLPESRTAVMVRLASVPDIPIVATHLAASRRNLAHRVQQIEVMVPWLRSFGPGLLVGDFNARPESPEIEPLLALYKDGWVDAWERGLTRGADNGGTRPFGMSRIDFVLYAPDAPVSVAAAEVVDTSFVPGPGEVSDHRPVVVTFRSRSRPSR